MGPCIKCNRVFHVCRAFGINPAKRDWDKNACTLSRTRLQGSKLIKTFSLCSSCLFVMALLEPMEKPWPMSIMQSSPMEYHTERTQTSDPPKRAALRAVLQCTSLAGVLLTVFLLSYLTVATVTNPALTRCALCPLSDHFLTGTGEACAELKRVREYWTGRGARRTTKWQTSCTPRRAVARPGQGTATPSDQ